MDKIPRRESRDDSWKIRSYLPREKSLSSTDFSQKEQFSFWVLGGVSYNPGYILLVPARAFANRVHECLIMKIQQLRDEYSS